MPKARLIDELRKRQTDLFTHCSHLVQIPSENPPGNTNALASFINQCDPYVTPPDSRLVRLVLANAREITRRTVLPVVRLGYTDGRFFRRAGFPLWSTGLRCTTWAAPMSTSRRQTCWTSPSSTPAPSPTC